MERPDVCVVAWTLPAGGNVTGTPAHVLKSLRALNANGAEAWLLELELASARDPAALARVVAAAGRALWRRRPDVVHAHGHVAAAAVLPLAAALRIPVVCELHGLYVPSPRGLRGGRYLLSRAAKAIELPVLRAVDHVVAQAQAMRDLLVRGGIAERKITVLYPGLRTSEFSAYGGPPAEIPGVAPRDVVALYAGSTHAYQGLDLLARAQRHLPAHFRVVLALSRDAGDDEDAVQRFGYDPARTVAFHLARAGDLAALFRRADVLVHARPDLPDNANVQSKLGLYLASGRPLAVTNVGDYRALLSASAGCVLADAEPASVARAIVEAATRPEVAAAARTENVLHAETHFEADRNVTRLVEQYAALARRSGEPRARDAA
jgi:glycosyltransferase involved in cell wall biosynthesis